MNPRNQNQNLFKEAFTKKFNSIPEGQRTDFLIQWYKSGSNHSKNIQSIIDSPDDLETLLDYLPEEEEEEQRKFVTTWLQEDSLKPLGCIKDADTFAKISNLISDEWKEKIANRWFYKTTQEYIKAWIHTPNDLKIISKSLPETKQKKFITHWFQTTTTDYLKGVIKSQKDFTDILNILDQDQKQMREFISIWFVNASSTYLRGVFNNAEQLKKILQILPEEKKGFLDLIGMRNVFYTLRSILRTLGFTVTVGREEFLATLSEHALDEYSEDVIKKGRQLLSENSSSEKNSGQIQIKGSTLTFHTKLNINTKTTTEKTSMQSNSQPEPQQTKETLTQPEPQQENQSSTTSPKKHL